MAMLGQNDSVHTCIILIDHDQSVCMLGVTQQGCNEKEYHQVLTIGAKMKAYVANTGKKRNLPY